MRRYALAALDMLAILFFIGGVACGLFHALRWIAKVMT